MMATYLTHILLIDPAFAYACVASWEMEAFPVALPLAGNTPYLRYL